MKKIGFVSALVLFIGMTYAQNKVIGVWQLEEMTIGGETVEVHSMHVDFNQDGKLYVSGRTLGTWRQNLDSLETESYMQLDIINGSNKIIKLSDDILVLENEKYGIQTFKRTSLPFGKEYKNKIAGEYLLTKIKEKEKEENIGNYIVNFKSNGILYIQSMFFGKWYFEKKTKKLNISMIKDKLFNGENKIIKSGKELVLKTEKGNTVFLEKLDWNKISKNNKMSALKGLWEIKANFNKMISEGGVEETTGESEIQRNYQDSNLQNNPETHYIMFSSDNIYWTNLDNSSSTGIWIFKKNKSITFIGYNFGLEGENKIIEINENKFVLSNKAGQIFTATKSEQDAKNAEYLNFNEQEYFYITENGTEPKLEIDNSKIPWNDYQSNVEYLKNIKAIEYICYMPIEHIDVFKKTKRTISVEYSNEDNIILIDELFNSSDYPEKIEYGKIDFGKRTNHPYIIIEEMLTGKIIGQEKITTPAGKFECTVIEGYYDYDKKIKIWMINNKPGVYAKIICSGEDMTYSMFILNKIIK